MPKYMSYGNFAKLDPRPNLSCQAGRWPPKTFMLGPLAFPKTLEALGKIPMSTIWFDPLDPHLNSPPELQPSNYLWHIFGSEFWQRNMQSFVCVCLSLGPAFAAAIWSAFACHFLPAVTSAISGFQRSAIMLPVSLSDSGVAKP